MIRTIAAALAAFALVSFGAFADDTKPADATKTDTKAEAKPKKAKKAKKAKKTDATKTDATAPAK